MLLFNLLITYSGQRPWPGVKRCEIIKSPLVHGAAQVNYTIDNNVK